MVHLIDIILVSSVVGIAGIAVFRYFIGLAKQPKDAPVNCAGCNANCHPVIPESPHEGLLSRLK